MKNIIVFTHVTDKGTGAIMLCTVDGRVHDF